MALKAQLRSSRGGVTCLRGVFKMSIAFIPAVFFLRVLYDQLEPGSRDFAELCVCSIHKSPSPSARLTLTRFEG